MEILKLEKDLENARKKLAKFRKDQYSNTNVNVTHSNINWKNN